MSEANSNTIQLDTMSLEQLDQLKQREESRLHALTQRFAALRQAAARLSASALAVTELLPTTTSDSTTATRKDVFVPLTESVYIPGTIARSTESHDDLLLVELGTGYFVEQTAPQTVEFIQRKLALVNANSENVTHVVQATRHNLDSIAVAMRGKLLEIQARQQGQRHQAAAASR